MLKADAGALSPSYYTLNVVQALAPSWEGAPVAHRYNTERRKRLHYTYLLRVIV